MKKLLLLMYFISFPFSFIFGQVGKSRLYLGIDDYGSRARSYLKQKSNKDVKVILGDKIYPDKPGLNKEAYVNKDTLTKYIIQAFPNKMETGIGVLDWEGRSFDILILFPSDSPGYKFALSEFIKALQIAKKLRPNISWGYYGIPFKRGNFKTNKEWAVGNTRIASLLRACDIFCPNLYGYTPQDLGNLADVTESLRLSAIYKKKVYPFIWHRYNGLSTGEYQLELIPKKKFVNYTSQILNVKVNHKRVSGIIWWGLDTYFYQNKFNNVHKEAPTLDAFMKKYDQTIIEYSKEILRIK